MSIVPLTKLKSDQGTKQTKDRLIKLNRCVNEPLQGSGYFLFSPWAMPGAIIIYPIGIKNVQNYVSQL